MAEVQCKKCAHFTPEWCEYKRDSLDPNLYRECKNYRVKTNAHLIRFMTDDELTEFMCHNVSNGTVNCAFCAAAEFCRMGHNGWLDWLKQESECEQWQS